MVGKKSVNKKTISFINDKFDFKAHQQLESSYFSKRKSLKYTHMAWIGVDWFG